MGDIKTKKYWIMLLLGIAVYSGSNAFFNSQNKEKAKKKEIAFFKNLEYQATKEIQKLDDPYVKGIKVEFNNNYKVLTYSYSTKNELAYQVITRNKNEFEKYLHEQVCQNLKDTILKASIDVNYRYYYAPPTELKGVLKIDDPSNLFFSVLVKPSDCL